MSTSICNHSDNVYLDSAKLNWSYKSEINQHTVKSPFVPFFSFLYKLFNLLSWFQLFSDLYLKTVVGVDKCYQYLAYMFVQDVLHDRIQKYVVLVYASAISMT